MGTYTVPAGGGGLWVWSTSIDSTINGRGIASQLRVNGDIVFGANTDGVAAVGDSMHSPAALVELADGDEVTVTINHNLTNSNITLSQVNGQIKGIRVRK